MIVEDLKGLAKIWILGDNFIAETYRKSFKKSNYKLFMKNNFEVTPFCSSKYSDKNSNALSRIVNSFIQVLNSKHYLPEYMVVFLDSDLIDYLQYKKFNVATLLGPWLEFLAELFLETLQDRWVHLPLKARNREPTQVYWVERVGHSNFNYTD